MLHTCAHLKATFLTRDQKLPRRDRDAKAKDSHWQEACRLFNSQHIFTNPISKDTNNPEKYEDINPGPTGYVATAEKLKKEFGDLRGAMTATLVNSLRVGTMQAAGRVPGFRVAGRRHCVAPAASSEANGKRPEPRTTHPCPLTCMMLTFYNSLRVGRSYRLVSAFACWCCWVHCE